MRGQARAVAAGVTLITCLALPGGLIPALAAPRAPVDTPQAESRIGDRLSARLDNPRLGSDVAVIVVDARSGREVFARKGASPMRPASTMKIPTAVAVLATLGPDAVFTTRTFAGPTPNSVIVRGGGDPLLRSRDLRRLADLTAKALDPAEPVVVHADTSLFAPSTRAAGWPRDYIPSVVSPVTSLARLGDYHRRPTTRAIEQFSNQLRERGFTVSTAGQATPADGAAPIAEIADHTVREAVHLMLRDSENNVAEVLHRHVALAKGQPATWEGARTSTMATLAELGIDTTGLSIQDGSGLSRRDRLTAASLAGMLRLARVQDPQRFSAMFDREAMPIAGVSGTLDDAFGRFTTKQARCAKGEVRAKTGTLFDTIALSGLTPAADGEEKVFAILVNDRPQRVAKLATRQAVDGLAATINGCW